jgi:hypothetical protein
MDGDHIDVPAFSLGGFLAGPDNHVVDCTSHATTRRAPKNLKSIPRRGWTWDVGSFTGQIATLVEEDRYGNRIGAKGHAPKPASRELAASLHQDRCDQ